MNVNTGEIVAAAELERRRKLGADPHDYVEIPEDQLSEVSRMNRHERRKWAALQRKQAK